MLIRASRAERSSGRAEIGVFGSGLVAAGDVADVVAEWTEAVGDTCCEIDVQGEGGPKIASRRWPICLILSLLLLAEAVRSRPSVVCAIVADEVERRWRTVGAED